ncbi:uncharacterized protein FYW47_006195 [Aplochiton taeniatus]
MEVNASGQPPHKKFKNANGGAKRRQPQYSADIVYTKGGSIQTIPSLIKQLKGVTEPVIGLQYVWEYRSPSKSVPPHYQCKVCQVARLQHDMLAHVKGWRHSFQYLKRHHPDKVSFEEETALKDPAVRKTVKAIVAEVEKSEGRGQLRVILKEPCEVQAFDGLGTTRPKMVAPGAIGGPVGHGMTPRGPKPVGRFPDQMFQGEYPMQSSLLSDYPMSGRQELGMGGYSDPLPLPSPGYGFKGPDMGLRRFPEEMGPRQGGPAGGRDGFGSGGLLGESPARRYPEEFRGGQMGNSSADRPGLMGAAPEGSNLPATLLNYLDTFRIENESDAQIVLKVTQKLTDVLMDYRLRSVSSGTGLGSTSTLGSMNYSSPPTRMPSSGDRYPGNTSGSFTGSSRYSDGPSRYFH